MNIVNIRCKIETTNLLSKEFCERFFQKSKPGIEPNLFENQCEPVFVSYPQLSEEEITDLGVLRINEDNSEEKINSTINSKIEESQDKNEFDVIDMTNIKKETKKTSFKAIHKDPKTHS
jgi:hypothetical protein